MSTANLLADAERAIGELRGVGRGLPNPHLLINLFLRREAVLSSRIEGTTAGLRDLMLFESDPSEDPGHSDVREVANYVAALELGFALPHQMPICLRLIRQVHERLMSGVRGEQQRPGEFREAPIYIASLGDSLEEARFVPPPVFEMKEALNDLEAYIGSASDALPPLIQLALVHYQFETIHPFMDGNGRLGRLLIALQLREWGLLPRPLLYLSAYFERNRDAYKDHLLEVSTKGAWFSWIEYFLQGVAEQARDTLDRSHQLMDLRDNLHILALNTSNSGNLVKLVDLIFEGSALSIPGAANSLGITQPAASKLVQRLEAQGVLVEVTGKLRDRRYVAPAMLEVLNP